MARLLVGVSRGGGLRPADSRVSGWRYTLPQSYGGLPQSWSRRWVLVVDPAGENLRSQDVLGFEALQLLQGLDYPRSPIVAAGRDMFHRGAIHELGVC